MIVSPQEIVAQCTKWWKEVLVNAIEEKEYFPKEISRIGKITSKDILNQLPAYRDALALLKKNSKEQNKLGYTIHYVERTFDRVGFQRIPDAIVVESLEDYLKLTGKRREFDQFMRNLDKIRNILPALLPWVKSNPLKLVEQESWEEILLVCKYFMANPKPDCYIRQLPLPIHTKFIQENKAIIYSLLDFLIPEHLKGDEADFERRFNLKYAEPLLRIRFLDASLSPIRGISDLSFTRSEFLALDLACTNVFVTENLMNFLCLPPLQGTIAIWSGGGFAVSLLKEIPWLIDKNFYYWGDLDAQGFMILNQFRSYFPKTQALMMDFETLHKFPSSQGKASPNQALEFLTPEELAVYTYLREHNMRLEQEKISHAYALGKIGEKLSFF